MLPLSSSNAAGSMCLSIADSVVGEGEDNYEISVHVDGCGDLDSHIEAMVPPLNSSLEEREDATRLALKHRHGDASSCSSKAVEEATRLGQKDRHGDASTRGETGASVEGGESGGKPNAATSKGQRGHSDSERPSRRSHRDRQSSPRRRHRHSRSDHRRHRYHHHRSRSRSHERGKGGRREAGEEEVKERRKGGRREAGEEEVKERGRGSRREAWEEEVKGKGGRMEAGEEEVREIPERRRRKRSRSRDPVERPRRSRESETEDWQRGFGGLKRIERDRKREEQNTWDGRDQRMARKCDKCRCYWQFCDCDRLDASGGHGSEASSRRLRLYSDDLVPHVRRHSTDFVRDRRDGGPCTTGRDLKEQNLEEKEKDTLRRHQNSLRLPSSLPSRPCDGEGRRGEEEGSRSVNASLNQELNSLEHDIKNNKKELLR